MTTYAHAIRQLLLIVREGEITLQDLEQLSQEIRREAAILNEELAEATELRDLELGLAQ